MLMFTKCDYDVERRTLRYINLYKLQMYTVVHCTKSVYDSLFS